LKAFYDILVSSAETIGAFNAGFDTVNLHRPTTATAKLTSAAAAYRRKLKLTAKLETSSITIQSQALKPGAFNTGFNWCQPAPPRRGVPPQDFARLRPVALRVPPQIEIESKV